MNPVVLQVWRMALHAGIDAIFAVLEKGLPNKPTPSGTPVRGPK